MKKLINGNLGISRVVVDKLYVKSIFLINEKF